jgi:hypothetical protein
MSKRAAGEGPSWRGIQQNSPRKVVGKVAQQRRLQFLMRTLLLLLVVMAILAGLIGARYFAKQLKRDAPVLIPESTVEVVFRTDGVLLPDWFRSQFQSWLQRDLRDIDVRDLKLALEGYGQVASALVKVELPSRLFVDVKERIPLLRVRVRGADGGSEMYLIGRDGTVYAGAGYPLETLKALPGVAGLRLRRIEDGFIPVVGIEEIAALLETAKEQLPAVYRHWRLVDLSDWTPDSPYRPSLIRVRSTHIREIVFGTQDFPGQIRRLASILETIQRQQIGQPVLIDLSYPEEAVIRYQ